MEKRQSFGMLVVGGVIALGSIGVALFTAQVHTKPEPETSQVVVNSDSVGSVWNDQRIDTDGDGLPDWKESLLGTDKNNPDTDGDGTSDGEEVAMHANPLKVGTDPVLSDGYKAPTSLTSTEALARELFVGYANGKRTSGITEEEISSSISEAIENRDIESNNSPLFTISDLSVDSDLDAYVYERDLLKSLRESAAVREYELVVFGRAIESNDLDNLEDLRTAASVYKLITEEILKMDVPTDVAQEHLALVNSLSKLTTSVDSLGKWSGDPLDALALVDQFIATENEFKASTKRLFNMTNFLKNRS